MNDLIDAQQNTNLLQRLQDVSDQVNSVFELSELTLNKNTAVLEQIIYPTYFNVYPIDWTVVPIQKFSDLPVTDGAKYSDLALTYSFPFETLPTELEVYTKKMTTF